MLSRLRLTPLKEIQLAVHRLSWMIKSSFKPFRENWNYMKFASAYLSKNVFKPSLKLKRKSSRRISMPWWLRRPQLVSLPATQSLRVRSGLWNMSRISCLIKTASFWPNTRLPNLATLRTTLFKSSKKRPLFSHQLNLDASPTLALTMTCRGVLSVAIVHVVAQSLMSHKWIQRSPEPLSPNNSLSRTAWALRVPSLIWPRTLWWEPQRMSIRPCTPHLHWIKVALCSVHKCPALRIFKIKAEPCFCGKLWTSIRKLLVRWLTIKNWALIQITTV